MYLKKNFWPPLCRLWDYQGHQDSHHPGIQHGSEQNLLKNCLLAHQSREDQGGGSRQGHREDKSLPKIQRESHRRQTPESPSFRRLRLPETPEELSREKLTWAGPNKLFLQRSQGMDPSRGSQQPSPRPSDRGCRVPPRNIAGQPDGPLWL